MKTLALTLCASLVAVPAAAESFRMQTFLGANASTTKAFEAMAEGLRETTDGRVDITVLPGRAVVGAGETIEAIENGILDGQYTAPSYFAGKDPAMGVLGDTLAAYPDSATRDGWFDNGGLELARELYAGYGLHLICAVYWPPEQIPSKVEISGVGDLEGLKMRAPGGLASDLLNRAGASLVNLGVGESVTAMETGTLDATDLANVALNVALGMHNQAKYSVLARHSMAVTEMSVREDKWSGLSAEDQAAFQDACNAMSDELKGTLSDEDAAAVTEAKDNLGVTFIAFGEDDAATFRTMTKAVWDDWGSRSEMAGRIVESHKAYLAELGLD
ncbi:MAG: TRAP transporter substrate-binding protein DctP [Pseudomonadota bacterium]